MITKSSLTLSGLALGLFVLSGCTGGARQTYSGPPNRGNPAAKVQERSNPAMARQRPMGAQPLAQPTGGNYPMATQQGSPQYPTQYSAQQGLPQYPTQYSAPSSNMPGPVYPRGVPSATTGNSFRNPAGIGGNPGSAYSNPATSGSLEQGAYNPSGPALPAPTSPGPTLTPTGSFGTGRPISSVPTMPNAGFPSTVGEN